MEANFVAINTKYDLLCGAFLDHGIEETDI